MSSLFSIELINANDHIEYLLCISDECFGRGYLVAADFLSGNGFCFGAFDAGELVGFALSYIVDKDDVFQLFEDKENVVVMHSLKTVAVLPSFQRRGMGDALFGASIIMAESMGCSLSFGYGWLYNGSIPSSRLFEKYGFQKGAEIPEFWFHDSLVKQYECAICGTPPCRCSALQFFRQYQH
jgi:ribosomal protein S18 acetylase RimI-like enzyme